MISITPQGQVYLCKTPLINDYKNQLTFANKNAQLTYFNSTIQKTYDNYTYIKKDNVIKVGENIDNLIQCNYLFYKNTGFTDKWYFCFITNMEYINENCTAITIETDVFQTWYFDIRYKPCFIEREHVNDDTIGIHTIDENLNVGEVIQESKDEFIGLNDCYFCILTTYDPVQKQDFEGVQKINGTLFGYEICLFDNDVASVENFLKATNKDGKIEGVLALFMCPKALFSTPDIEQKTGNFDGATYSYYKVNVVTGSTANDVFEIPMPINATRGFRDYTPKNNKLYCYPYNYLLVSNGVGNQNIYRYEDFYLENGQIATNISFAVQVAFSISISARVVPRGYQKIDYNIDESLPIAKFPNCSWSTDAFTNWLTDNAVNVGTQVVATGAAAVASIATGNVAGIVSTSSQIANLIGQFYQANLLPSITGGNNSGDVNFSANKNAVKFIHMRAKTEYLKAIDNYFSMFGYKVNIVKTPNITGRQNWNYVKTINCNFDGNIPQTDLNIIRAMFNNGTTLWHNANTMYNYNNSNNIV